MLPNIRRPQERSNAIGDNDDDVGFVLTGGSNSPLAHLAYRVWVERFRLLIFRLDNPFINLEKLSVTSSPTSSSKTGLSSNSLASIYDMSAEQPTSLVGKAQDVAAKLASSVQDSLNLGGQEDPKSGEYQLSVENAVSVATQAECQASPTSTSTRRADLTAPAPVPSSPLSLPPSLRTNL